MKAWARLMRTPAKSCGAAAGTTTRKNRVRRGVPMFCAAQIRTLSTDITAWREAMNTGKKQEKPTIAILEA